MCTRIRIANAFTVLSCDLLGMPVFRRVFVSVEKQEGIISFCAQSLSGCSSSRYIEVNFFLPKFILLLANNYLVMSRQATISFSASLSCSNCSLLLN